MPKIRHVRIAGLKYEGFKKQYRDQTFQFHNESEATNTLISLVNGGGKGVLLQTLFQVVKPGTPWGKTNNRTYQQFFFNEKEKFSPYTFHVVIEWELDGEGTGYLLTGGIFSAERKRTEREEENEHIIQESIQFYAKTSTEDEPFSIDSLPLTEERVTKTAEQIKPFLVKNGFDVYRDRIKHKNLLQTYGIDLKDWDIIKDINKDEGGVGKYFEGAEDDHTLFQKKIIPIVSHVLNKREDGGDDLVDIFRSQASIAKDLPILLNNERAYKEIIESLHPLEEYVEKGMSYQQEVREKEEEGQRYIGAFTRLTQEQQKEINDLKQEMAQTEQTINQLHFEQDNLQYVRLWREMGELKKRFELNQQALLQAQEERETADTQAKERRFQWVYKEWDEMEQTLQQLNETIASLEEKSNLATIQQELKDLYQSLHEEWGKVEPLLQKEVQRYASWMKTFHNQKQEWQTKQAHLLNQKGEVTAHVKQLEKDIQAFEQQKQRIKTLLSEDVLYQPEKVKKEKDREQDQNEKNQQEKKEATEYLYEQMQELAEKLGSLRAEQMGRTKRLEQLEASMEKQREKEQQLLTSIHRITEYQQDTLTDLFLVTSKQRVDDKIQQHTQKWEEEKRHVWEYQMQASLNQEDVWIANSSLKQAKEAIERKIGDGVYYGSAFLRLCSEKEREDNLKKFPLLPYALVMNQKDWEMWKDQELTQEILGSPVPIYIPDRMDQGDVGTYHLVTGKANTLVTDERVYESWKATIEQEKTDVESVVYELSKTLRDLQYVRQEIEKMEGSTLAISIQNEWEKEKEQENEIRNQENNLLREQAQCKETHRQLAEEIRKLEEESRRLQHERTMIDQFVQEKEQNKEHIRIHQQKEMERIRLEQQIEEAGEHLLSCELQQDQWRASESEWRHEMEAQLKQLGTVLTHVSMPVASMDTDGEQQPTFPPHLLRNCMLLMETYENKQKSKEEKSMELIRWTTKREHHQEKQKATEKRLVSLRENWRSEHVPTAPIHVLRLEHEQWKKQKEEAEKKERLYEKEGAKVEGKLEDKQEQVEKKKQLIRQLHHQEPQEWSDVSVEDKEWAITNELKRFVKDLQDAKELIEDAEKDLHEYKNNQEKLTFMLSSDGLPYGDREWRELKEQPETTTLNWVKAYKSLESEREQFDRRFHQFVERFQAELADKDWDHRLKHHVLSSIQELKSREYTHASTMIEGMRKYFSNQIQQKEKEKERAEQAQLFWASRAAMKVHALSDAIRKMVYKMKFKNELGHFPLVSFKEDILPKSAEEAEPLLRQHFVDSIDKITKQFDRIDEQNAELTKEIKRLVGDEQILLVALRQRYPVLNVYNMQTNNAFMNRLPRKEYYSTWKTINTGSQTKSDGSGGQKLSARMIVMMMLLSVKHEHDSNWIPLICDNPFGQAASSHVLDPMFLVAKELKFQLIVVAPPELVKTDISQRFPVYYKLDFAEEKGKEYIQDTVQFSYRVYQA